MTIYTRMGNPLTILANCGEHLPRPFRAPVTLLWVEYENDKRKSYQFKEFLKATNGIEEIEAAVIDVPTLELYEGKLAAALRTAA